MNRRNLKLFSATLALLMITSRAQAQYSWHVTQHERDSNYVYAFTSVSCYGDNCTAGAIVFDVNSLERRIIFFKSNDGGNTWLQQDPELPRRKESVDNFSHIQQIDSLNAVAAGADTGLIVRTSDGGKTWVRRDCHTSYRMVDIHFYDSLVGITISAGSTQAYITSDGGKTWKGSLFQKIGPIQCHSYGNGKFRLYNRSTGIIYTTYDNWITVDSTKPIFYSMHDSLWHWNATNCTFSTGDTILAYGNYFATDSSPGIGLIVRSINGGVSWEPPVYIPATNAILHSTFLEGDTIFAGGQTGGAYVISTDRGKSWKRNKIILDTIFNSSAPSIAALALSKDGTPIMGIAESDFPASAGVMVKGVHLPAKVESYERIIYNTRIFPNPAFSALNIISIDPSRPFHIYDMLGREVMQGKTSTQGKATFDVSMLPRGIYDIILDHFGKMLPIGKVAVMGK